MSHLLLFSFISLLIPSFVFSASVEEIQKALPGVFSTLGAEEVQAVLQLVEYAGRPTDSPTIIQGRLTLTSGTTVTTSDVTAATTVYYTPHNGNKIALYSGTAWQLLSFAELSVAVPANTVTPFDIFAYNNSGSVALEALAWTNDTTRATALTKQDGVYVKTGVTTRRYLGTARTTSVSGQTEDSATKRFLWNYYNRVPRPLYVTDATASWSYNSSSWRSANSSTSNRVQVVVGVAESMINLSAIGIFEGGQNVVKAVAIGEDSVTTAHSQSIGRYGTYHSVVGNIGGQATTSLKTFPSAGYHYYQWLEQSTGLSNFYGSDSNNNIPGINGEIDG